MRGFYGFLTSSAGTDRCTPLLGHQPPSARLCRSIAVVRKGAMGFAAATNRFRVGSDHALAGSLAFSPHRGHFPSSRHQRQSIVLIAPFPGNAPTTARLPHPSGSTSRAAAYSRSRLRA